MKLKMSIKILLICLIVLANPLRLILNAKASLIKNNHSSKIESSNSSNNQINDKLNYKSNDKLNDKNEQINFKDTLTLYFSRGQIECEDDFNQTICSENVLQSVFCENLNYEVDLLPKWICGFKFSNEESNSSLLIGFDIKCDRELFNQKSYRKASCSLKYKLKLDVLKLDQLGHLDHLRLSYSKNREDEHIVWNPVTISIFSLIGLFLLYLLNEIIFAVIHRPKKSKKVLTEIDLTPTSSLPVPPPERQDGSFVCIFSDVYTSQHCCDACCNGFLEVFCQCLGQCCVHTASGIASTSFR